MANSIHFHHPSLMLGHVVDRALLGLLTEANALQAATDGAQDRLNALISMRRGFEMTLNELHGFDLDLAPLKSRLSELDGEIAAAAGAYLSTRIANDTALQGKQDEMAKVPASAVESPISFKDSEIQRPPLASDSMRVDVQYFNHAAGDESSVLKVQDAVRKSAKALGSRGAALAQAAGTQVRDQRAAHQIVGTLLISATCTHRHTATFEPLVLDPARLLKAWNAGCTRSERLDETNLTAMQARAQRPSRETSGSLALVTGVTYASSFVGMVHVSDAHGGSDTIPSAAELEALRRQVEIGSWLGDQTGDLGADGPVAETIRRYLGKSALASHANVLVLGAIPPLSASKVNAGVDKVLDWRKSGEPSHRMFQGEYDDGTSVHQSAAQARQDKRLVSTRGAVARSVLESLGRMETNASPAIDANAMMAAFDNYLATVTAQEAVGVPVGFLIRYFSAAEVARLWLRQYALELRLQPTAKDGERGSASASDAEGATPTPSATDVQE